KAKLKGKVAIELDIDRQFLLPFGNAEDIYSYIKSSILALGSKPWDQKRVVYFFQQKYRKMFL
ncbi:MAG: hypothetical protein QXI42_12375, partial [Thermoproteota archaeon]